MATIPVVTTRDDLAPLVKASLQHHDIPVTAAFDVFDPFLEGRFIAVSTPIAEAKGLRKAYISVFSALEKETFAPKNFLRLHTLVLSSEELKEIRRFLKKGMFEAVVPRLAHLQEVIVRPVEDAKNIEKTGLLQIAHGRDDSYLLTFAGVDGPLKRRKINSTHELNKVLASLGARGAQASLGTAPSITRAITCTLETLYREGLV